MTKDKLEIELIQRFFEDRLDYWEVGPREENLTNQNVKVGIIPENAKTVDEVQEFVITEEVIGDIYWRMKRIK
ncbi:MAG: hypothetical protein ACFFG0_01930 [Candidatus Thorarchaeota archaeon]